MVLTTTAMPTSRCVLCCTTRNQICYRSFSTSGSRRNAFVNYLKGLRWVPIPVGVGFAYIAYQQYGHVREREKRKIETARGPEDLLASQWQVSAYRILPLNVISRTWGRVNNWTLPEFLRSPILRLYIWAFNCNLDEAAVRDLRHYKNLAEFFRRPLRQGVRPVDSCSCLTSPCDGKVLYLGTSDKGMLEQVKGVTYPVQDFLGPNSWPLGRLPQGDNREATDHKLPKGTVVASSTSKVDENIHISNRAYQRRLQKSEKNKIYHCVLYLAPGDYHRFHSPVGWDVSFRRHFPGDLLSVSPFVCKLVRGLFSLNERAVYIGQWEHGFFGMAAVGATNVGCIRVYHDKTLETNSKKMVRGTYNDVVFCDCESDGVPMKKGEMFGEFNLGSTIVLVFEAPPNFKFAVEPGQKVKTGEPVGNIE